MGKVGIIEQLKKLLGYAKTEELSVDILSEIRQFPISLHSKTYKKGFEVKKLQTKGEKILNFKIFIKNEQKENLKSSIHEGSISSQEAKVINEKIFEKQIKISFIESVKKSIPQIKYLKIEKLKDTVNREKVKRVNLWKEKRAETRFVKLLNRAQKTSDGTFLSKKLRIKRRRNFFHYSKKEQLKIWKKIIEYTRKRPKELELLGLFSNFPLTRASEIKINFKTGDIYFSIDEKNSKIKEVKGTVVVIRNKEDERVEIINFNK